MEKTYQIKTYGFDGSYKQTVSPTLIMNEISFSNQINGGQGEYRLKLNLPINTNLFEKSDIVKITCFDDKHIDGRLIYTGYVSRIKRFLQADGEYIELSCVGLFSILNRVLFYDGSFVFTKSQDPSETIKDAIDYFNSIYTANFFSYSGVDSYGESLSIDFNYRKCNEVLSNIQAITSSFFFFVGADGNVQYKNASGILTNHRVKIENQVDNLTIDENIEVSANKLYVQYSGASSGPYSDAPSQSEFGVIEKSVSATGVTDLAGADIFGADYLENYKAPKKQTTLTVNSKYDIESIKPGDTITIFNTSYEFSPLLVNKVQYTYDKVILSLDKYETFAQAVLSDNQ